VVGSGGSAVHEHAFLVVGCALLGASGAAEAGAASVVIFQKGSAYSAASSVSGLS
jgi:hypothetical protein